MPDVRPHRDALLTRLQTITGLVVHDGEVPKTPTVDNDGRIHPYAVLYPGAGRPWPSSLAYVHADLDLPFQVTCVGGDVTRCLWAVDKVRGVLLDHRLVVDGRECSRIGPDGDAGPVKRDDDVSPPRHYLPLLMRLRSIPA